jgi:hypothetical protein
MSCVDVWRGRIYGKTTVSQLIIIVEDVATVMVSG